MKYPGLGSVSYCWEESGIPTTYKVYKTSADFDSREDTVMFAQSLSKILEGKVHILVLGLKSEIRIYLPRHYLENTWPEPADSR